MVLFSLPMMPVLTTICSSKTFLQELKVTSIMIFKWFYEYRMKYFGAEVNIRFGNAWFHLSVNTVYRKSPTFEKFILLYLVYHQGGLTLSFLCFGREREKLSIQIHWQRKQYHCRILNRTFSSFESVLLSLSSATSIWREFIWLLEAYKTTVPNIIL